jgi:hypothetical protein
VTSGRSHDVRPRPTLRKHLNHPELGELELERQTLLVPGTDLRLVICTADPGSPSAAALARLGAAGSSCVCACAVPPAPWTRGRRHRWINRCGARG